jgi:hypothetical protein
MVRWRLVGGYFEPDFVSNVCPKQGSAIELPAAIFCGDNTKLPQPLQWFSPVS